MSAARDSAACGDWSVTSKRAASARRAGGLAASDANRAAIGRAAASFTSTRARIAALRTAASGAPTACRSADMTCGVADHSFFLGRAGLPRAGWVPHQPSPYGSAWRCTSASASTAPARRASSRPCSAAQTSCATAAPSYTPVRAKSAAPGSLARCLQRLPRPRPVAQRPQGLNHGKPCEGIRFAQRRKQRRGRRALAAASRRNRRPHPHRRRRVGQRLGQSPNRVLLRRVPSARAAWLRTDSSGSARALISCGAGS